MSRPDNQQATPRPSRRDFLKTSTALAGTALTGGLAIGRSAHAAGDDVLKVGLIGCGGRGTGAANNALTADKNTKLVAMADVFADKLQGSLAGLRKQFPDRVAVDDDHCFTGFDAYGKLIDSGVDVVILAATPHFRPIHLKACIDAGKHVFCEKPVAIDAPGVRSVLATTEEAKKKKLSIVSGLCWRYHHGVRETMKRIMDGAIGDIITIHETYNTGFVGRQQNREPAWSEMEFQLRNWYFFNWLSGDHNVEQHIHSLDKAAWAMNDEPPVQAWGLGGRQIPKPGNIFDHHAVVYEYPGGLRVCSYTRQQSGCWNETTDHFFGTKGYADVLKFRIDGENEWRFRGDGGNMYVIEHEELFKSIRSGEPINNGVYMARSTMLAILGRMVNYTGQLITWDQAINSQETLAPKSYSFDVDPPVMPDENGNYPIAMPGVTKFS